MVLLTLPPPTPPADRPTHWHKLRDHIRARLAVARVLHLEVPPALALGSYDRAKAYLQTLRTGVLARRIAGGHLADVRVRKQAAEASRLRASHGIVLDVGSEEERRRVPLWLQGDEGLSTEETLRARQALRRSEPVVEVMDAFWQCAMRTEGHSATAVLVPGAPAELIATREAYECILLRAYRVLLEEWDADDAAKCIREDWAHDVQGGPGLPCACARRAEGTWQPLPPPVHKAALADCRRALLALGAGSWASLPSHAVSTLSTEVN